MQSALECMQLPVEWKGFMENNSGGHNIEIGIRRAECITHNKEKSIIKRYLPVLKIRSVSSTSPGKQMLLIVAGLEFLFTHKAKKLHFSNSKV